VGVAHNESSVMGGCHWFCLGLFIHEWCWSFMGTGLLLEAGVIGWGS
jgi:hypothetical protein